MEIIRENFVSNPLRFIAAVVLMVTYSSYLPFW